MVENDVDFDGATNDIITGEEHGPCSGCLPRVPKGVKVFAKLLISNDDSEYFPEYVIA